jgi:hypothetical protein
MFADVSAASESEPTPARAWAAIADFDQDGRLDIFVPNDKMANFLFHNEGNGKFREWRYTAWRGRAR